MCHVQVQRKVCQSILLLLWSNLGTNQYNPKTNQFSPNFDDQSPRVGSYLSQPIIVQYNCFKHHFEDEELRSFSWTRQFGHWPTGGTSSQDKRTCQENQTQTCWPETQSSTSQDHATRTLELRISKPPNQHQSFYRFFLSATRKLHAKKSQKHVSPSTPK